MPLPNGIEVCSGPSFRNPEAIDSRALPMVMDMERAGIRIDQGHFHRLKRELEQDMSRLRQDIIELAAFDGARLPADFNPGSGDQLAKLLFRDLHLPSHNVKDTPSGSRLQVNDESLAMLEHLHPVVASIREWTECKTLLKMFVAPLPARALADGRIHCDIITVGPETGRYAAKKPNLLAIPTRSARGRKVKEGFIPSKGCVFVSIDGSQIELRVGAHESRDAAMCQAFHRGLDIHSATASEMFDKPIDALDDKLERYPAKRVNFMIFYGGGPPRLTAIMRAEAGRMDWTDAMSEGLIARWFESRPGVGAYIKRIEAQVKRCGFVWSWSGRVRYVPEHRAVDRRIRAEGNRQAINHPIQCGAVDILKVFMIALLESGLLEHYQARPLLQIHDEVLFDVPEQHAEAFAAEARPLLCDVSPLSVPMEADAAIGHNLAEVA